MNYYLYSHSNADGIFYIGKGCDRRFRRKHLIARSAEWHEASKDGYTSKIEANGTEADILSLERIVIKSLVEKGVNLVNKVHNPNYKRKVSAETKKKQSDATKGQIVSDETKQKLRDINTGKTYSAETKKKHSYSARKQWQKYRFKKANNYKGRL